MFIKTIKYIDMFSGVGGFREGLTRAGGFTCVGHCEIDKYADRSYRELFQTEGEWFCDDARKINPAEMPEFDLLCGGFPCQPYSAAGKHGGFGDPRGTLFFEIARLVEAKKPRYLLLENVPGLLWNDQGRSFYTILRTLSELGYLVEWQVLDSKNFGVAQSRKRIYITGFLDPRCSGKILPITEANSTALVCLLPGKQGRCVYDPQGLSCTLTANKTGLYALPIGNSGKQGVQLANPGDSISLAFIGARGRKSRIGKQIAHTLTTAGDQGVVTEFGQIRRLTPREALRLQGYYDSQIDKLVSIQSDSQLYKQAGNGVTVTVVEAIGNRLRVMDEQMQKEETDH